MTLMSEGEAPSLLRLFALGRPCNDLRIAGVLSCDRIISSIQSSKNQFLLREEPKNASSCVFPEGVLFWDR